MQFSNSSVYFIQYVLDMLNAYLRSDSPGLSSHLWGQSRKGMDAGTRWAHPWCLGTLQWRRPKRALYSVVLSHPSIFLQLLVSFCLHSVSNLTQTSWQHTVPGSFVFFNTPAQQTFSISFQETQTVEELLEETTLPSECVVSMFRRISLMIECCSGRLQERNWSQYYIMNK